MAASSLTAAAPPDDRQSPSVPEGASRAEATVEIEGGGAGLSGPGGSFTIRFAADAQSSRLVAPSPDPQIVDDGATLLTTTTLLDGDVATYELELSEDVQGATIRGATDTTTVLLTGEHGQLVGGVVDGGSTDAEGNPVATEIVIDGTTITQMVAPGQSPTYPVYAVAAASTVWYSWVNVVTNLPRGYRVDANPTAAGRKQIAWNLHSLHVDHVRAHLTSQGKIGFWNWNIEQQFVCHVVGAYFPSGVYNMESWQPALSWQSIANPWDRCNRIK